MYQNPISPSRGLSAPQDETRLPRGQCRYLLLHPEIRGQRCACVRFALHRSTPGSSCECGHQAVYHLSTDREESPDRAELDALKAKIGHLEGILHEENYGGRNSLTSRIGELEELIDKYKVEMESEVKSAYRGIEGLWHNVWALQNRVRVYDDRFDAIIDYNQSIQDDIRTLQGRIIDIDDAEMLLEDRVDALNIPPPENTNMTLTDSLAVSATICQEAPTGVLTSTEENRMIASGLSQITQEEMACQTGGVATSTPVVTGLVPAPECTHVSHPLYPIGLGISKAWTVHVSLLPKASQPFPFEKDTLAYKRCLSRGLQRMVAIPSVDSQSFVKAISEEFCSLLSGRDWMPLVPKVCDAEDLVGLPMLRQLPAHMINDKFYSADFLKAHCATLDHSGKIIDLYIAMREQTFSWTDLKPLSPFIGGLEACWDHDPVLDGPRVDDNLQSCRNRSSEPMVTADIPSAGDLVIAWPPPVTRIKRTAAEISLSPTFSSVEGEGRRTKFQRSCAGTSAESLGRRAEAV